jgi:hypothetical protein
LEVKIKVLNVVKEYPNWSLHKVQKFGAGMLKRKEQQGSWREDLERGGARYDKWKQYMAIRSLCSSKEK